MGTTTCYWHHAIFASSRRYLYMTGQDFAAATHRMYADSGEVSFYSTLTAQWLNCIEEALVCRAFAPGQLVLDVGCGAGREAVPMARYGLRVVAMDFVYEMV